MFHIWCNFLEPDACLYTTENLGIAMLKTHWLSACFWRFSQANCPHKKRSRLEQAGAGEAWRTGDEKRGWVQRRTDSPAPPVTSSTRDFLPLPMRVLSPAHWQPFLCSPRRNLFKKWADNVKKKLSLQSGLLWYVSGMENLLSAQNKTDSVLLVKWSNTKTWQKAQTITKLLVEIFV